MICAAQIDILEDVQMQLSERHVGLMRALMYPVQLQRDPLECVDEVLARVVYRDAIASISSLDEYRAALDHALACNVPLATLVPEYHPEPIVRRYLAEVRRRLGFLN